MGRVDDQLLTYLVEHAGRAPFVELVSLLERALDAEALVGADGPPEREALVFRNDPSLGFPTSDVREARLRQRGDGTPFVELTTLFLGLTGQTSPLPGYFLEEMLDEDPFESPRRDFLDLFHHRLLGVFYRGATRLQHYRHFRRGANDRGSQRALCLTGSDAFSGHEESGLTPEQRLSLTPLLRLQAGSRHAVEQGLRALFGEDLGQASIRVVAFTGGSVELAAHQRARLGVNARLGQNGTLGRFIPHRASAVRIEIGPLDDATFARFAPDGDRHGALCEAVQLLLHHPVDFELSLCPAAHERPGFALSAGAQVPLGRSSWLRGAAARPLNISRAG